MGRLLWVAVGATAAVAGARRLGLVHPPEHGLGRVAGGAAGGAAAGARAALRTATTAAGVLRALSDARHELLDGMAEREQQLRDDLLGDVDVEALRAARAAQKADARRSGPDGGARPAWQHDAPERGSARAARARQGWADGPTEDPDDGDGELPYAFY